MREKLQFYIDGQWVDPIEPRTLDVVNPATEAVYGRISLGSAADVDVAVAAAKRAFDSYSQTTREQRMELLQSILDVFARRHDEVAEAIMDEMGAPWGLAKGAQAASGPQHIKAALKALKDFEFEERIRTIHKRPANSAWSCCNPFSMYLLAATTRWPKRSWTKWARPGVLPRGHRLPVDHST